MKQHDDIKGPRIFEIKQKGPISSDKEIDMKHE
jgi:hypothetical protein